MSAKTNKLQRLKLLFANDWFFYGTLAFLVLSSAYFALLSLYPMAFDEEVHVGLIKAYSELWNPFALVQKPEYDMFGTVVTDPSWLFHYLMSFPYRVLDMFIASETAIIITLRFINIALFTAALVVFRKLLLKVGVSRAVAHAVFAVLVLIPVVPLLAGQVNYDNLLMLVTAGMLYLMWVGRERLRAGTGRFVLPLTGVILLMLYGSIVKYALLPIIIVVAAYGLYELIRAGRRGGWRSLLARVQKEVKAYSLPLKIMLFVGLFAGVFLFSQRYVLNMINYGSPVPACDAVMSVERCRAFGPYNRTHNYLQNPENGEPVRSMPHYAATHFAWGMWHRLYFTIAGPTNSYHNFKHLPIVSYTAAALVAVSALAFVVFARSLLRQYPAFWLFLLVTTVYIGILLVELYGSYSSTGRAAAINGRYLIPLLPLAGAMGATALVRAAGALKFSRYLGVAAVVAFLLLLQGGGPFGYITQARPSWFWNETAAGVNETLDKIFDPLVIGNK